MNSEKSNMDIFSCDDLLQTIRKYRLMNLTDEPFEKIKEMFDSFVWHFNIISLNVGNLPLFRVRRLKGAEERHERKKEVWSPPAQEEFARVVTPAIWWKLRPIVGL